MFFQSVLVPVQIFPLACSEFEKVVPAPFGPLPVFWYLRLAVKSGAGKRGDHSPSKHAEIKGQENGVSSSLITLWISRHLVVSPAVAYHQPRASTMCVCRVCACLRAQARQNPHKITKSNINRSVPSGKGLALRVGRRGPCLDV